MSDRTVAAHRYKTGALEAPSSFGSARVMPTKVKTGRAAALANGITHLVLEAATITQDGDATLATRWHCGGGSVNAIPVADGEAAAICATCVEMHRLPRGPLLYRCYDATDNLLYIGSTGDAVTRTKAHRSGTRWWPDVDHVTYEPHPTIASARQAEARAIASESALHNVAGVDARATP